MITLEYSIIMPVWIGVMIFLGTGENWWLAIAALAFSGSLFSAIIHDK